MEETTLVDVPGCNITQKDDKLFVVVAGLDPIITPADQLDAMADIVEEALGITIKRPDNAQTA